MSHSCEDLHHQPSFPRGTYDWQVVLARDEHFLPEAKAKLLSGGINLGKTNQPTN